GLDQRPWTVANRGDRFARGYESLDELDRLRIHPQFVRIDDTTRQEQGVEFLRFGFVEGKINWKLRAPIRVVPRFNLAFLRRDQHRLCTSRVQGFTRLRHLR